MRVLGKHWGITNLTATAALRGERMEAIPHDSLAGAVASEVDQPVLLIAVQAFDRIVEAAFRILLPLRRQGVIDPCRPAFLFKSRQDRLLIRSDPPELFHEMVAKAQLMPLSIPAGYDERFHVRRLLKWVRSQKLVAKVRFHPHQRGACESDSAFRENKAAASKEGKVLDQPKPPRVIVDSRDFLSMLHIAGANEPTAIAVSQPRSSELRDSDGELPNVDVHRVRVIKCQQQFGKCPPPLRQQFTESSRWIDTTELDRNCRCFLANHGLTPDR